MKKISMFGALIGALFGVTAYAADITVYYSPTCPHCHHARDFISNNLIYEYPELNVTMVNVMESANRPEFMDTLKKCEYESGGVPVLVIGEKCFQGYADSMADDLRAAVEADMTDAAKSIAAENKKAIEADADAFKRVHEDRLNAIVEREIKSADDDAQKKNRTVNKKSNDSWVFYVILVVLVLGLGFVLTRKGNKK
ncbi:MAG: hypothetical protein J5620_02525 [Alphaproteobacteria bacterium]|nr:hypothetical protein [Alphaproteobacteria bacterium]